MRQIWGGRRGAWAGGSTTLASVALPVVGLLVLLALWHLATTLPPRGSILTRFAPAPAFAALSDLAVSGEIWEHALASLRRIGMGLLLALGIGVPVGLAVGGFRGVAGLTSAAFQLLRMISPLSWTPIAIILFGVGDAPVYFLIAAGAVWPVILNVAAGVHALDPRWLTLARSLGANRRESFLSIIWPGIRAHVLTGFRLAVGLAWIIVVPAEMLGVDSGLGYFVLNTRDRLAYSELMAAIVVIGLCGFAIDVATRWVVRQRWTALTRRRVGASIAGNLAGARAG